MDLWPDLPTRSQSRRVGNVLLQQPDHELAPGGDIPPHRPWRTRFHHLRADWVTWLGRASGAAQHNVHVAASAPLQAQSRQDPVAVHAQKLPSKRILQSEDDIINHCRLACNNLAIERNK